VIAVGTCLGIAGLLVERVLPPTWPRRWLWCAVIAGSLIVPPIYRARHTSSVLDGPASLAGLDPAWWIRLESAGTPISRYWLVASTLLLVWGLASALWVSGLVRLSRREGRARGGPAVVDGVPVLVTESMGPATVGVWRSRVMVPRWVLALPGVQRRYVVVHEEEHRRAHDARLLFVASLSLLLLPWNLALWWQLRRLRLAVEMDCDNRVVASLGDPTAYGALLLEVAQAASRGPRLQPALLGGVGMLERRLLMLLDPAPVRQAQRFLLPALALGLLLVVLAMPHPVLGRMPHAHGATTSAAMTTSPPAVHTR
jgi:hypothetical protein